MFNEIRTISCIILILIFLFGNYAYADTATDNTTSGSIIDNPSDKSNTDETANTSANTSSSNNNEFGEFGQESSDKIPKHDKSKKGHPKLDSRLNQLVKAHKDGQVFEYSLVNSIELNNESVRVVVESLQGNTKKAFQAASALGVVETSYGNLFQVTLPISQLEVLADNADIRLVRSPLYPLPAVVSEGASMIKDFLIMILFRLQESCQPVSQHGGHPLM